MGGYRNSSDLLMKHFILITSTTGPFQGPQARLWDAFCHKIYMSQLHLSSHSALHVTRFISSVAATDDKASSPLTYFALPSKII